jgi:hypothetical protein
MAKVKRGDRFLVVRDCPAGVVTRWKAPFTDALRAVIPAGSRWIAGTDQIEGAEAFVCDPQDQAAMQPRLVPAKDRDDPRYDGFYVVFRVEDIGTYLAPLTSRRYTIRLRVQPGARSVTYGVVTSKGERMAVAMAGARLGRREPEMRLEEVELIAVEDEFAIQRDDFVDNLERRYTIQLELQPDDRKMTYTAVTSMGELTAAVLAGGRHVADHPEDHITAVSIVAVEDDFAIDPKKDLLSYWERA